MSCPKAMRCRGGGTTGRAPDRAGGFPQDPEVARRHRGLGPPRLGAHEFSGSRQASCACGRTSRRNLMQRPAPRRAGPAGVRDASGWSTRTHAAAVSPCAITLQSLARSCSRSGEPWPRSGSIRRRMRSTRRCGPSIRGGENPRGSSPGVRMTPPRTPRVRMPVLVCEHVRKIGASTRRVRSGPALRMAGSDHLCRR